MLVSYLQWSRWPPQEEQEPQWDAGARPCLPLHPHLPWLRRRKGKRNNNDHQKREIRSKKNPILKTCLSLSALWDRYRQNMHMDERVRGERKIRIWFLGKSTSETKVGRKDEAENCRELKINIETRSKKELRIELMRDVPMPLFLYKTSRVGVLALAVLTEYLIRPLHMIEWLWFFDFFFHRCSLILNNGIGTNTRCWYRYQYIPS